MLSLNVTGLEEILHSFQKEIKKLDDKVQTQEESLTRKIDSEEVRNKLTFH
jgi:hypothetical protein